MLIISKGNSIFYSKLGLQIPDLWSTLVDHNYEIPHTPKDLGSVGNQSRAQPKAAVWTVKDPATVTTTKTDPGFVKQLWEFVDSVEENFHLRLQVFPVFLGPGHLGLHHPNLLLLFHQLRIEFVSFILGPEQGTLKNGRSLELKVLAPSNDQSADPPIRISRHEFGSASDQLAIGTEAFFFWILLRLRLWETGYSNSGFDLKIWIVLIPKEVHLLHNSVWERQWGNDDKLIRFQGKVKMDQKKSQNFIQNQLPSHIEG